LPSDIPYINKSIIPHATSCVHSQKKRYFSLYLLSSKLSMSWLMVLVYLRACRLVVRWLRCVTIDTISGHHLSE
ncbi:unnamed protein product, partial [Ceratitis capitata]